MVKLRHMGQVLKMALEPHCQANTLPLEINYFIISATQKVRAGSSESFKSK